MENLIPIYKEREPEKLDFCDCCCSYQDSEEVFSFEEYKFCINCAIDNKGEIVKDLLAKHNDITESEIICFVNEKIKKFNPYIKII